MRIVIVGAGVAGCIMARSLARLPGLDVTCLERVARDDHSGIRHGPQHRAERRWRHCGLMTRRCARRSLTRVFRGARGKSH